MKNLILFFVLTLTFFAGTAQQKTFKTAVDFNDFVVNLQDSIGYSFLKITEIVGNDKLSIAEMKTASLQQLEKSKAIIKFCTETLQKVKPFEKGELFKTAAINLFNYYYKTVDVQYRKIIEILSSGKYGDEETKQISDIQAKITAEEKTYDDAYINAQDGFAKHYHFELEPNKLEGEFKK